MNNYSYILLTAAKNEEAYIEKTILSVIYQTILPQRWIIIVNNSDDATDEIVKRYANDYSFISMILHDNLLKGYAAKSTAINVGLKEINGTDCDFIGILDADITFAPDYYENVITRCLLNSRIGIAGGDVSDFYFNKIHPMPKSPNHVRGAVQLFRSNCFRQIGYFRAITLGGEDTIAELIALKNGWEVNTFYDLIALHHRKTGTGVTNSITSSYRRGKLEYSLGYLPLYQLLKSIRRIIEQPFLVSSLANLAGYWIASIKKENKVVSNDLISFLRKIQQQRIRDTSLHVVKNLKSIFF